MKPVTTKLLLAFGVLLLLTQLLYDPLSTAEHSIGVKRVQREYHDAGTTWEQAAISDYQFEIHSPLQSICAVNAVIEVRDGTVSAVKPLDLFSPLPDWKWADPDWGNEVFLCNYAHFTFTRILEMVGETLQTAPSSILAAEFDPQYGFITHYEDGIFSGHGWLSPKVSEFYNEFTITDFQEK